jgi:hypothetical protein
MSATDMCSVAGWSVILVHNVEGIKAKQSPQSPGQALRVPEGSQNF